MRIKLFLSTIVIIGLGLSLTPNVFATQSLDHLTIAEENSVAPFASSLPYMVNVSQLNYPRQVSLYTDDVDKDRNITTEATRGHVVFNFRPSSLLKHTYVKIIEDDTNLKVVEGDMGKQGTEYTFIIKPQTFRANHFYTIHQSTSANEVGDAIGRFEASSGDVTEIPSPVLNKVTDKDKAVTGTGVPETTANIYMGEEGPFQGKVKSDGTFSVEINKQYEVGTKIRAFLTDNSSNKSEDVFGTVEASNSLNAPVLNTVLNTDTVVTGTGEPGTRLYLFIGGDEYRELVDEAGNFNLKLDRTYSAGTSIRAYLMDNDKNKSSEVNAVVEQGKYEFGVNKILTTHSSITGKALPNSKIEVEVQNTRSRIFSGRTNSDGEFTIDMNGTTYQAGTRITVSCLEEDDTVIDFVNVIVYPAAPTVYTIKQGDEYITGKGEANALITVFIGDEPFTGKANSAGDFSVEVPKLVQDQRILVKQNSNGIDSDLTQLSVQSTSK